ncbi:endo-1,3;1,4-beta-D-glucanase isoform X2 [Amborella trichopoda]|uniref:endo-1,3;1,4-beta-D-glucanase isoform X2 n=1 Tax=Amborella trichopoda TaxID=13333 RepID=UPI0009C0947B|nr:endo-1,3;1,4-beta-D-glucanase isoform X2 [Amborella trichopoda]|eukprot:XP_020527132.1 endo-1,3;1,4-beta-D-glucanase isoform X2 [Amborella trichopoda]
MAGPQCCENPPTLRSSSGEGHVEELGGLKAYVTGSSDSKRAIVLVSDIFGFEAPNLRRLADKVASAGYYVVVTDYFYGDPFAPDQPFDAFPNWLQSHKPEKAFEVSKPIIEALKSKGISAIGAGGFCWGELAKSGSIQAAVLLHPSLVKPEDISEVKCPIAILGAEIDKASPPELVKQFEEILSTRNKVDNFVKIFPGVAHGWTVRYSLDDETVVKNAEEAHTDMLNWFNKYVV